MNFMRKKQTGECLLTSPLTGRIVPISEVTDEVFSQKILGDGVAVRPSVGELRAPADGQTLQVFDTEHALTMRTDEGVELLLHLGIDTVRLGGRGFCAHVKAGQRIRRGELLLTFALSDMQREGYDMTTPVVVSSDQRWQIVLCADGEVQSGEVLLQLKKTEEAGENS